MGTVAVNATQCAALADLLEYPWETPIIKDPSLNTALKPLITFIRKQPLEELQDLFTRTFDLAPVAPPYLGFHVHGESYRRGTLMANLRDLYRRHGIEEAGELPDHVGVVLRLLAATPGDEEVNALIVSDLKPGLDKLLSATEAEEKKNPYRAVLLAAARVMEDRLA